MLRAFAVTCFAVLVASHSAGAQERPVPAQAANAPSLVSLISDVPERPRLRSTQTDSTSPSQKHVDPDTNDARVYYAAGIAARATNPTGAAAAFYWASRIDPSWADPYAARWYVLSKLTHSLPDSIRARIDSLSVIADGRDPFFDDALAVGDMTRVVVTGVTTQTVSSRQVTTISAGRPGMYENQPGFENMPPPPPPFIPPTIPAVHTWYTAYAQHDFANAASRLRDALKKDPDAIELYVYRAKSQFFLGQFDSAAATMQRAIARIDSHGSPTTLPRLLSKDALTYAIGIAQQHAGHDSAARAAFQAAIAENPGYYMAHLHLASLALASGDATTALSEAQRAVDMRPTDPVVQLFLGYYLLNVNRAADAVSHFDAAIRADSDYALAFLYLGEARVTLSDTANALAALHGFLARAPRDDDHRVTVQSQIDMFKSGASTAP